MDILADLAMHTDHPKRDRQFLILKLLQVNFDVLRYNLLDKHIHWQFCDISQWVTRLEQLFGQHNPFC